MKHGSDEIRENKIFRKTSIKEVRCRERKRERERERGREREIEREREREHAANDDGAKC